MARKTRASTERRISRCANALHQSMLDAEAVEPDEQVRALGECALYFAEWSLAIIDLGDILRRDDT